MSIWQLCNKNVYLQVARFDCGLIVMKGKAYFFKKKVTATFWNLNKSQIDTVLSQKSIVSSYPFHVEYRKKEI